MHATLDLSKAQWIDPLGRTYINEDYDERIPKRFDRVYANHGLVIAILLEDLEWRASNEELRSKIIESLASLHSENDDDEDLELARHREAAIQSGWIRVRPLGAVGDQGRQVVFFSGTPSELQRNLLEQAAKEQDCDLMEKQLKSIATFADSPIQPNKSIWLMPDGEIVDVHSEGWNEEETAYSHGIYVKKWLAFRLDHFCPGNTETELATKIRRRALQLIDEKTPEEEGGSQDEDENPEDWDGENEDDENPFENDQCYNQAAEEHGWIRIKPLTSPRERTIFAEMATPPSEAAQQVLSQLEDLHGLQVKVLTRGALSNLAFTLDQKIKE